MLIACEKCGTQYHLDDKLIPSAGAPVQCTRCQHVFTARLEDAAAAAPAPAPTAAPASSTMMFASPGKVPVTTQPAWPQPSAAPPATGGSIPSGTLMFSSPQGQEKPAAAGPAQPSEAPRVPSTTMMFAVPKPPEAPVSKPVAPGGGQTLTFASPVAAPPRGTAAMGQPPVQPVVHAGAGAVAQPRVAPVALEAPARATLQFGMPGTGATPDPDAASTLRLSQEEINRMMVSAPAVAPAAPQRRPQVSAPSQSSDELERVLATAARDRGRVALWAGGLVVGVIALLLAWPLVARALRPKVPAAAVTGVNDALAGVRLDDSESHRVALERLDGLVKQFPLVPEVQATRLLIAALDFDDAQLRVKRYQRLLDDKSARITRYTRDRQPADWELRVGQLQSEVARIKSQVAPWTTRQQEAEARLRTAFEGLKAAGDEQDWTPEAQAAALRAQAMFHAVGGSPSALSLSERYRKSGPGAGSDGWIDLADAAYVLNATASQEATLSAHKALKGLCERDSTFLRCGVVLARIDIQIGRLPDAQAELERVVALHSQHDTATELLAWVKELRAPPSGQD